MALPDPAPHIQGLLDNLKESISLLDIHGKLVGRGPGRKYGVEVLNKSSLVLVVACWEAYVEDTAATALEFMIENAPDHTIFPKNVLERVSSSRQGIKAWGLAGDGWKQLLRDNMKEVLAKTTGTLNTPRAAQVDDLFLKTIGLNNLSSTWKWNRRKPAEAIAALDQLISTRGAIAHRVMHSEKVYKQTVRNAAGLIGCLAARTNNETRKHVHALTGKHPWYAVAYGGVK